MEKIIDYVETDDVGNALVALSYDELNLIGHLLMYHTANWVDKKLVKKLSDKVFKCKVWLKEHW